MKCSPFLYIEKCIYKSYYLTIHEVKTEITSALWANKIKANYFFHVFSISTPINSVFFCILISNYLYEIGLLYYCVETN